VDPSRPSPADNLAELTYRKLKNKENEIAKLKNINKENIKESTVALTTER
jgi:hypothetical protein